MANKIDKLLKGMLENGGSDLHLNVNHKPKIRMHGRLASLDVPVQTAEDIRELLQEICPEDRWQLFLKNRDLDFAYEIPGVARFRANYLYNFHGQAAILRQIPAEILTMEDLNLPPVLKDICEMPNGLVCVTGPTGSGKSTTMAAMIDYINENYSKHIITIEDPIEFVHKNKKSIIVHREAGHHTNSFATGLMSAMHADPDIILLGEMRDVETIRLALTCAAMGVKVFGTLHTNNAPKTIDRILDAFPADEQPQIRTMLAQCLKGVVSQLLCRKSMGGRVAVHEILLYTDALPNIIREGQIANIRTVIEGNVGMGMCSMDSSLKTLMNDGVITPEEAYIKAISKRDFIGYLDDDTIV